MNKNKLYWQIAACMVISAVAVYGGNIKNETFAKYYAEAKAQVMYQLNLEDVKEAGKQLSTALADAPAKVVSVVADVNSASKYGEPMDEKSDTDIKQVHAVAGGMVLSSGRDDKMGLYVKIKHEDAISVYGNLSDISVFESERVQRGEIIGSFDTNSGKEFYYDLQKNM
ncbi:Membrane-bound metallopeptidase [uncultured Eubacterium sp.]|uniref:M23 family metallopeptidase n=1 Tax=Emergencia sp. TaxID=1926557 RepID=UPI00082090FA|nr:Membrane-bound metallopeptidase [uncultured Eubacterium sp.]